MARSAFFVLSWRRASADLHARVAEVTERLRAAGWVCAGQGSAISVWTEAASPLPVTALAAGGWILGAHYPWPGASVSPDPPATTAPIAAARRLSRTRWGQYVAVLVGPRAEVGVYRDPSGHLEAAVWSLAPGLDVIASDLARAPPMLRPPRLALDWRRIATFLTAPGAATTDLLLAGAVSLGPGDLRRDDDDWATAEAIWTPAMFAKASCIDLGEAKAALVAQVDACAAAMASGHRRLLTELSGGLDSAIVAGSLAATGHTGRVAHWLNFVGARADGDEQRYAAAVTDRIGARLTACELPLAPLTVESFTELARRAWPAVGGADAGRDRAVVACLEASGATGLVSGQGGDAVFFQMPTALIFADALRRDGPAVLMRPLLGEVARRARTSVWTVLARALRWRPQVETWHDETMGLVASAVRREAGGARHAWVKAAEAAGLPPGKRLQILAIANCHVFRGESRRTDRADLLHPLLAQPVVELALGIAVPDLAGAPFDRPFARDAFRGRVPQAILERRVKGQLSPYFGHLVAASADALRPFLMEGCLVAAGYLDRAALANNLDPDRLIWNGRPTEVLQVAALEAWVRHWQGQVPDAANGWAR